MSHVSHRSAARAGVAAVALLLLGTACADAPSAPQLSPVAGTRGVSPVAPQVVTYDAVDEASYQQLWANPYGLLNVALGSTLTIDPRGIRAEAVPFTATADFSVFDHLKYIGTSTQSFAVPKNGSLTFAVDITAATPGTQQGRVIQGCYGGPYSFTSLDAPCAKPWSAVALEGQQAGVVLNMINFATGQLFDWFVSDHEVFALIERLPSNVTGSPDYVGLDKAYTQIIKVASITPGSTHRVAIRFTRGPGTSRVEYFLDGALFTSVTNVGVPLDVRHLPYTGIYPSYGPGEPLGDKLDSFVIGHGLFSLLDAFPFQHPEAPLLSVSVPEKERTFGQGAIGIWKNFQVTTVSHTPTVAP
jgi:hypothetical protein